MYNIIGYAGYASKQDDMRHPSHTVHVGLLIIASVARHKANLNVNDTTPPSWEWCPLHAFFTLNDGWKHAEPPFGSFSKHGISVITTYYSTGRELRRGKADRSG